MIESFLCDVFGVVITVSHCDTSREGGADRTARTRRAGTRARIRVLEGKL